MGIIFNDSARFDRTIAERLAKEGVEFFHADNIEAFRAHCDSGRLLCRRELMEVNPDGHTPFDSDEYDQNHGFDSRVFGNIYDLGSIFERAHEDNGPYIYGPIMFVFRPEVYMQMTDIIIVNKSMFTLGNTWRDFRLCDEAQLDSMLNPSHPDDKIHRNWHYAELNCSNCSIPLSYLSKVVVEPLEFRAVDGQLYNLYDVATRILSQRGIGHIPVEIRKYRSGKRGGITALRAMVEVCQGLPSTVTPDTWNVSQADLPGSLNYLSDAAQKRLIQWGKYFTFGTVRASLRTR